jgi:hypothetical protein
MYKANFKIVYGYSNSPMATNCIEEYYGKEIYSELNEGSSPGSSICNCGFLQ